jgi:hypothetical protein
MIPSPINKGAYPSIHNILQFQELFSSVSQDKKILVVLDIDDTMIQPAVRLNPLIDALKAAAVENSKHQEEVLLINQLVSEWRLQRKVILTDDSWPDFLKQLQNNPKVKVVALTQMDTGAFGHIESIEKWRYDELKDQGLVLKEVAQDEVEWFRKGGSYYGGIYFTGQEKKGNILQHFILPREGQDCNYLVLLDDKEAQLTNMTSAVENSIEVRSLQFIPSKPSEKLGSFEREFIDKISNEPSLKSCVEIQEIAQKLKNDLAPDQIMKHSDLITQQEEETKQPQRDLPLSK